MFTLKKCDTAASMALLGGAMCAIGKMVGVALWADGTTFADSFGKTNLDTLIQEGKFIGSVMADGIENNDAEINYSESTMKIRTKQDAGRKGFALTFQKSPCFHNELMKLDGSTAWNITPILDDGTLYAYRGQDGILRPFAAKIFVGTFQLPIMGAEGSGTRVEIDLMPKALSNWQNNGVVLENTEIDFTEVNPVAGVNITVPILTAGATTTTVKVTNLCSDAAIKGLTDPQWWKMERNGVLEAVTAVSATPDGYTFTHTALKAGEKVRFVTDKNGMKVVPVDTNYYSGESMVKTVA